MDDVCRAEFQEAAVERAVSRLSDPRGPRRFLVADEVGLGKTIVASGVIRALAERRKKLTVVYLCSNAEIAEQNRQKLDPGSGRPLRRVTELAFKEARQAARIRLYSFTPGTSLRSGTGLAWERRLILFLAHRLLRVDIRKPQWREFFRCGAGPEGWKEETRFRQLVRDYRRQLDLDLQDAVRTEWQRDVLIGPEKVPLVTALREAVERFDPHDLAARRRRNVIVGALREAFQRAVLDRLNPDLIILDEIQRFRDVLDQADDATSVAGRLFRSGAGALVLSATPYRLLALDHEGGTHYKDFLDTVRFLFGPGGTRDMSAVRADLEAFRARLEEGRFVNGPDPELLAIRERLEERLRRVISRTERNWYIEERGKGVEEHLIAAPASGSELRDYVRLRRYLLDKVETSQHVTEYWKSCPAPFTFMDASYVPMASARESNRPLPRGLVARATELGTLAARNARLREVTRLALGDRGERWKFLWTRPSYTYYRDQFFGDDDPRKLLVFSGWRFVPKALALLLSNEAEAGLKRLEFKDRAPLRFTDKGASHIFDVCLPSPALAEAISPASAAGNILMSGDLVANARRALRDTLRKAGIEIDDSARSPLWKVVARLEQQSGSRLASAIMESSAYRGGDVTERFRDHADDLVSWTRSEEHLRISKKQLHQLAVVASFSPAVSLLRALWSVYPDMSLARLMGPPVAKIMGPG